jgi:hypothetical protein
MNKLEWLLLVLACFLFYVFFLGSSSNSSSECDIFDGHWEPLEKDDFQWLPHGCSLPRYFTEYKRERKMDAETAHLSVLLIGDSNARYLMSDLYDSFALGVKCGPVLQTGRNDTLRRSNQCVSPDLTVMIQDLKSIFPFPTEFLNYCEYFKEYGLRNIARETLWVFKTPQESIDDAITTFPQIYQRNPQIIEFSVNFWEPCRIRQESICEKQERTKNLWEST